MSLFEPFWRLEVGVIAYYARAALVYVAVLWVIVWYVRQRRGKD